MLCKIVALTCLFTLNVDASYLVKIKVSGHSATGAECAGAVIHRNFVLTTAACIEDKENAVSQKVVVEGLLPNGSPFTVYGNAIYVCPCHDSGCGNLALIRLMQPVESAVVAQFASYPVSDLVSRVGTAAEVPVFFGTWKAWPDHADVAILDCQDLDANISQCSVCATAPPVCENDGVKAGMPLMLNVTVKCSSDCSNSVAVPVVVGISSNGNGCGRSYGVYTRVSRYSDWIRGIVCPGNAACYCEALSLSTSAACPTSMNNSVTKVITNQLWISPNLGEGSFLTSFISLTCVDLP